MIAEIQKTEAGKKLSAAAEEALKQARIAAESLEKAAEQIGDTQIYQNVSQVNRLFQVYSFFDSSFFYCSKQTFRDLWKESDAFSGVTSWRNDL